MSRAELCVTFEKDVMLNILAEKARIDFLTPESKPQSYNQACQCAQYILKTLGEAIAELADDKMQVVRFAKALKLDEGLDMEKEMDEFIKTLELTPQAKSLLKKLLAKIEE